MASSALAMIVIKLGGSLLSDVASIRTALSHIKTQPSIGIVVVSALKNQTRQLLQLAQTPSISLAAQLIYDWQQRFDQARISTQIPLIQSTFALITHAGQQCQALSMMQQDALLAQGELLTSWLVYQLCQQLNFPVYWHDIRDSLQTDSNYSQAQPLACQLTLQQSGCMITQGYIGVDAKGHTTTLGFEGSDYSASLIAVATQASALWIYKDVGALYSADPSWLTQSIAYPYVSYQQAIAMAQAGASILHPHAVQPAQQAQMPIYISALDSQQQTCISQRAYAQWFALVGQSTGLLTLLGHYEMIDWQAYPVVQHSTQYITLALPPQQLDTIAQQWHQQLMEVQTCLLQ